MGCVNFKAQYERLPGPRNPVILAADTAFSISDVEALTVLFKKISNSIKADGKISKEEFKLALLKDSQRQSLFADRIFTLFDVRQKGKIYLADFVKALNVFHPDTPIEAKIDFSFKLYDLNGDGVIERQEVRDMIVAILRELQHEPTDELLEYILNKTFMDADVNRDGKIDIDEWRGFVNRNPGVIKRNMTIPHLREVTTIFPEFVFHSTVEDDQLVVFEQPGASSSTAQPGGSTSTAQPAAQPGVSTSTAQPGYLTSTVQPAALSEGSTTSTVQPAALSECSTTSTVQPAALSECSTTSTVQPANLPECSTTSIVQPAALSECSTTSTVQPAALPECSTSTAQPAAQPGCSTSTIQTDVQPECSTSTAQPRGSTSAAQPEAQPRRSSSTSSDEFKHFF
ncbi:calcineurin B-like protein 1 [Vicia villosa]|uniref:calcineurin B-like protein 1 n=1 Tax=Vicia villosa TaxID=3911 RepID=UPI00273B51A9|nr:calcineurin B-like protein 1 [Vicia villosa]